MPKDTHSKTAVLYRMVMPEHTWPYGLKSRDLLEREGFEVADLHLKTRAETDAFIGGVGAISVFKAVYVDNRELECACVGRDSTVPLGFVSLTENLMMVGMALVMGAVALG